MTHSINTIKTKSRELCPVCECKGRILYEDIQDYGQLINAPIIHVACFG